MSTSLASPVAEPRPGSLLAFFLLTFAISEACFVTAVRIAPDSPVRSPLVLLGTFMPGIVSLALTYFWGGSTGVGELLGRILRGPVAVRWWVFAVLFMPVVKLLAALGIRVMTGTWPRFDFSALAVLPLVIPISTLGQAGEELGWRGYALPRMAARMGLGWAGILLGAIWALWHLPLFYLRNADTYHESFLVWALGVIAISVMMAWLWAKARGSLLVVMLLHAAINNTKDIVPSGSAIAPGVFGLGASRVGWTSALIMAVFAGACLVDMRRQTKATLANESGHRGQPVIPYQR